MEKCVGCCLDRNEGCNIFSGGTSFAIGVAGWNCFSKKAFHHISRFCSYFCNAGCTGLSLPLLIRLLKIKPQDNTDTEEKELQLYFATSTLHFIEQELPVQLDNKSREYLKNKYQQLINNLTKEVRRHKKAKHNDKEIKATQPGAMTNARLEISKFQRALLLKLHKEGDFGDAAIKKIETQIDVDEMKLNLEVPKDE